MQIVQVHHIGIYLFELPQQTLCCGLGMKARSAIQTSKHSIAIYFGIIDEAHLMIIFSCAATTPKGI